MIDPKKVMDLIDRLYVVDGATWLRESGGLHIQAYDLMKLLPKELGRKTPYVCVPTAPTNTNNGRTLKPVFNQTSGQLEAYVGENGEYWAQYFLTKPYDFDYTNVYQCAFRHSYNSSWNAWRGAQHAFYQHIKQQVSSGQLSF